MGDRSVKNKLDGIEESTLIRRRKRVNQFENESFNDMIKALD